MRSLTFLTLIVALSMILFTGKLIILRLNFHLHYINFLVSSSPVANPQEDTDALSLFGKLEGDLRKFFGFA